MTASTRIRPATPADLPAVSVLAEEVNAAHHAWAPEAFDPPGEPARWVATLAPLLGRADATLLVAETASQVTGYAALVLDAPQALFRRQRRIARLHGLAVAARLRGLGTGRALAAAARDWALGRGADALVVEVWDENEAAIGFYGRLGWGDRSREMGLDLARPLTDGPGPGRSGWRALGARR